MTYTSALRDKVHRTDGTHPADPSIGGSTELSSGGVSRGEPEHNLEHNLDNLEKDWELRIRNLEQCICKLLIKNEQLRMSLASAKTPEGERRDDSYNGRSTVERRILNGRNR